MFGKALVLGSYKQCHSMDIHCDVSAVLVKNLPCGQKEEEHPKRLIPDWDVKLQNLPIMQLNKTLELF